MKWVYNIPTKVLVMEDKKNLDKVTMNEFHEILTSYEMRTEKKNLQEGKQPSRFPKGQKTTRMSQVIRAPSMNMIMKKETL